jgi:alkylation response protein AidB-like acyl-CoA dehydrogenase
VAEPAISFAPTEEMGLIRSTARQFLEDRVGLRVVRDLMMSEDGFDPTLWKEIADLGWTGLIIPEEHGGAGYGLLEMSVILEEMGRLVTPGPFFASSVLATTAITTLGTDAQKADLLPALAAGERIMTIAVFEGPRDWALARTATRAHRNGSGWVLDGIKTHVIDGHIADVVLVAASTDDGPGMFVVPASDVVTTQVSVLDPTRRQATVSLQGVEVEEDALLGGGPSEDGLRKVLAIGSLALAAEQVGGAQRCLDMAVGYAKTRHQFGRPIGSYQAVKHRCAEMLMRIEHARSTAMHAVRVVDDPDELAVAGPLAASTASEAYVWSAGENIQIHGGIGFTWEHDAHLYLKRAKSSALLLGDPRYHRDLLGRAIGI